MNAISDATCFVNIDADSVVARGSLVMSQSIINVTWPDDADDTPVASKQTGLGDDLLANTVLVSQPQHQGADIQNMPSMDTLEVFGFGNEEDDESIQFFFENKSMSGGGPLQKFTFDSDKKMAILTFEKTEGRIIIIIIYLYRAKIP